MDKSRPPKTALDVKYKRFSIHNLMQVNAEVTPDCISPEFGLGSMLSALEL